MAKYKYKIIIEVPEQLMKDKCNDLHELITAKFPQIEGLAILPFTNEIEWHQDCGVEAVDVKEFIARSED